MATKNKRGYGNPYASSDLGSGAKTTTGGSYTNPRLGIQDYTAFGRGFGSTFQLPKGEEKESIDIPDINLAGEESKKNKFFTIDGVEYNIDDTASKLFLNNFKNDTSENGLLGIQNRIINTKQGSPEYKALLNKTSQYNQVFGANADSNLSYLFSTISDPSKVDFEATKKYGNIMLPGLNPRENSKYSINAMAKRFHDGRLTPATITHDGIEHHGVKDIDTGEFINLGAVDKNWVNTNIKSFYNISDNILANYDDVKEMVKSFKPIEFKEKTFQDSQGKEFQVTEETQYYREGQINNFERQSNVFADNEFKAILESDELPSAIRQINELVDNGYFAEPSAGNDKFNVLTHKQNIENFIAKGGAEDDPIYNILQEKYHQARVKDYLNENFKLSNGAGFYNIDDREATKGRSVARIKANAEYFETSRVEQKETDDSGAGSGGSWSSGSSISDIRQNLFTQDLTKSPTGKHQGKMVLLDDNTMGSLQREITSRFGQGNFIFKKDRLEDMLIKSELSENEDFEDYESIDDLSNKERTALDLRIKKQIANYSSQYPEGQIFTYINGKVDVDTILQDGMMYNKDIKDFIKSFGSVSERKDIEKGWAGSDLQKEDMKVRNAVKTGDMTGLTDWEKKQAEFIIARKKIK